MTFRGQTSTAKVISPLRGQRAELKVKLGRSLVTNTPLVGDKRSKVGQGVAGSLDYGDDSSLYEAMGFVRKSEKKSGLTRKKKSTS